MHPHRPLQILIFSLLFLFQGISLYVGSRANWESADGFDFMVEARRGQNSQSVDTVNWERPRALVAILMGFDSIFRAVTGNYPTLRPYHIFMALISTLSLVLWFWFLELESGTVAAGFAIVAVMLVKTTFSTSFFCLSDVLAGIFFVLALHITRRDGEKLSEGRRRATLILLLALVALCKHQEFIFPFVYAGFLSAWLLWQKKTNVKNVAVFIADISLGWFLTVEAFYRMTTHFQQGFLTYVKYLFDKSRWAFVSEELTPRTVYVTELWQSFGPALVIAGMILLVASLIYFSRHRRFLSFPFAVGLATTIVFLILNQRIPNREPRYLLPFLPLALGFLSAAACRLSETWRRKFRYAWVAAWLLLFVPGFFESAQTMKAFWARTALADNRVEVGRFWNFLADRNAGGTCRRIWACEFWGYDAGPGAYLFYTGVTPRFKYCPSEMRGEALKKLLTADTRPGDCFVLRHAESSRTEVQKVIRISENEADQSVKEFFF